MLTEQQKTILGECKRLEVEMRKKLGRKLTPIEEQRVLYSISEYQAMMAEKARKVAEATAELEQDERPLVEALTAAGWPAGVQQVLKTRSVWDLVHTRVPYPHLIETLIDHMTCAYGSATREGIARALTVKGARGSRAGRVLVEELKTLGDPQEGPEWIYKGALMNALDVVGDASIAEDVRQVLEMTTDQRLKPDLLKLVKTLQARK